MAFAAKRYYDGYLTNTVTTTLYTNPGSVTSIIKMISLVNTDAAAAHTVTIRGPGTTLGNEFLMTYSLNPLEVLVLEGHWILLAGETLTGGASAASAIAAHITGAEG